MRHDGPEARRFDDSDRVTRAEETKNGFGVRSPPAPSRGAPRRDLLCQLLVWTGFGLAYEVVRGASGNRSRALRDGLALIHLEDHLHALFEPHLEHLVLHLPVLAALVTGSYWASEFGVLVLALIWTYVRARATYRRLRDAVIAANVLGLVGYVLAPTAPPRVFTAYGFTNALSGQPNPAHPVGLIGFAANPYAAMPSVHAADALLVAYYLAQLSQRPLVRVLCWLWPLWVSFCVLASGNHFWLDVIAGAGIALAGIRVSSAIASRFGELRGRPRAVPDAGRPAAA